MVVLCCLPRYNAGFRMRSGLDGSLFSLSSKSRNIWFASRKYFSDTVISFRCHRKSRVMHALHHSAAITPTSTICSAGKLVPTCCSWRLTLGSLCSLSGPTQQNLVTGISPNSRPRLIPLTFVTRTPDGCGLSSLSSQPCHTMLMVFTSTIQ